MAKARERCGWCLGSETYQRYHDEEWGVPLRTDRGQFEFLILEGAQAGLSWSTILHKRENYRKAFAGFDMEKVARFTDKDVARLMNDAGIVRNRLKILGAITNARCALEVSARHGGLANYLWSFVDGKPVQNRRASLAEIPATSPLSDAMAKELKRQGFKFVGSTVMYAHMQATGMINDHLVGCFRHKEVKRIKNA